MTRRQFFARLGSAVLGASATRRGFGAGRAREDALTSTATATEGNGNSIALFLAGDVMTGRGIDQILPHPSLPDLHESYVKSALEYVSLAEQVSGPIARPVDFGYIWGDALAEIDRIRPDARVVNLETSVTVSDDAWPRKGIHYRMHPGNVACLSSARLDCCVLANNHVLDWGRSGLAETLATLHRAGIQTAGAGVNADQAAAPAIIEARGGSRILVFAYGMETSGVPDEWSAQKARAGVNRLEDLSPRSIDRVARHIALHKRPGDIAVMSIHWGGNWGYDISSVERAFAHALVDTAKVDVVHGHSSHHVKGIEVYQDKPILYGCGDLLDDYEGIRGYEAYRANLALMFFPSFAVSTTKLLQLSMVPTRTRRLRINLATVEEIAWLASTLNREGRRLGTRVDVHADHILRLRWN